jgi:hypothetical protein
MKPINLRESDFKREIQQYAFHQIIKEEFFDYWSEPDRAANPKMRFEKEKTWHLGRRLARWARNSKTVIPAQQKQIVVKKEPVTEVEKLDAFINEFRKSGASISFERFGEWYEFMKANKLLKKMTVSDIEIYRKAYGSDNQKCRCAVVQDTLTGYINNALLASDLLKMRVQIQ